MTRRAHTHRTRLAVPVAVVLIALSAAACSGASATRPTGTSHPTVGPEAGVTSHYGRVVGRSGQPTGLAPFEGDF